MSTQDPFVPQEKKLPSLLNVLTILTFIGSGFALLSIPFMKWSGGFVKKAMENPEAMSSLPPEKQAEMEKTLTLFKEMEANSTVLWIITLLAVALCVYGAIQMRKLKKEGFYLYAIGELFPLIATGFFIGFATQYVNMQSYIFGIGIPVLFVILYATQLKYMK